MSRIYPLFSSSKGNCTYIGNKTEGILIDCGVSYSRIRKALADCGISIENAVKAVFITHGHSDHVSGLKTLSKKLSVPVYARRQTLDGLVDGGLLAEGREMDGEINLGSCRVRAFSTSHDVPSCGYRIDFSGGSSCAVCTDLGFVSEEVVNSLRGCKAVLIESNYDNELLSGCDYPSYLKSRIRSNSGHLSNTDCGALCAQLIPYGTEKFILGHLSRDSNTPERALLVNEQLLSEHGFLKNRDYIMTAALPDGQGEFTAF
ncbi:MAG: MBL fold metallo-hydrolase [Oscillospiraceae bacterium]